MRYPKENDLNKGLSVIMAEIRLAENDFEGAARYYLEAAKHYANQKDYVKAEGYYALNAKYSAIAHAMEVYNAE